MRNIFKQPLLHFVLIGFLLFLFYTFRGSEDAEPDGNVISVDRDTLLTFLQYRANAFNEELFSRQLDSMGEEQRQLLIQEYFREEALYREALAMGMDEGDYNIKLRMVEKLQFLLQDSAALPPTPSDEELQQYYAANASVYTIQASYTFTHVFVDDRDHTAEGRARAEALLMELRDNNVPFLEASAYGDGFPYLQNYVRRSRDFIRNNFDDGFADWLDTLEPRDGMWEGPVTSPFGYHLVMFSNYFPANLPPFEEMRDRVLDDYQVDSLYRARRAAEDNLLEKYELEVGDI